MKKLAVVLAVVVSGFINGQELESAIAKDINDLAEWANTTKSIKTGDYDVNLMKGLLKTIYSDPVTKYKYAELNPKIGEMLIVSSCGYKTIDYKTWCTKYVKTQDTTKYVYTYRIYHENGAPADTFNEIMSAYDEITDTGYQIMIVYVDGCLRGIMDFSIGCY
jgi:hypothetical protein